MAGIQDLGNGRGLIYMTTTSGDIIKVIKNSSAGVREMRANGLTVSPLAAKRSAYGILQILTAIGSGTITGILVNGVNQISSTITVVSTDPIAVAIQVAAAINAYVASPDCVAVPIADTVVLTAPQSLGASANGWTITPTITGGSITYSTTPFTNGSSETGIVDTNVGRNFYLNADYDANGTSGAGTADPENLTNAIDVTVQMVTRGLQVGLVSEDKDISGGLIYGIERASAITVLNVDTEGAAVSDKLGQIDTTGFVDGDIILLRGASPTRIVTVVDRSDSSSGAPVPNFILNQGIQFTTNATNNLMLQLREVSGIGFVWSEINRSTASAGSGIISLQLSEAQSMIAAGSVIRAQKYLITDYTETDLGFLVEGSSPTSFSPSGAAGFYLPAYNGSGNFSGITGFVAYKGTWYTGVYSIGDVVSYQGYNFKNVTGNNNSDPVNNTDNDWLLLDKSLTTGYVVEWHFVVCNLTASQSTIMRRSDGRGNIFYNNGTSNHLLFKWGCDTVTNNISFDGCIFNNINAHNGLGGGPSHTLVKLMTGGNVQSCDNNVVLSAVDFNSSFLSDCENHSILGSSFLNTTINGNIGGSTLFRVNSVNSIISNIRNVYVGVSRLSNSLLTNLNGQSLGGSNFYRQVSGLMLDSATLSDMTWNENRIVSGLQLIRSTFKNITWNPTTDITGGYAVTTNETGFGYATFENVFMDFQNNWNGSFIVGVTSNWAYGYESVYVNQNESSMYGWLDISSPSVYNAVSKKLTIPAGYNGLGEIWLKNTSGQDIRVVDSIVNYGPENTRGHVLFGKRFRVYDGTGVTFTPIAAASYNEAAAASGTPNGFMGTVPITISRDCEYVLLKRVANQIYVDKYVVVT